MGEKRRRAPAGARPERPTLDQERIVRAAMRTADAEGTGAISMRRIASEMGAGTMSLYRHVDGKEDLLDRMLDAAYGEMSVPERPSGDWRADLAGLARQTRSVLGRHPWVAALPTSRPTFGPCYMRWFELSLAVLAAHGLDLRTTTRVVGTVNAYVAGFVGYELGKAEANRRHGLSEPQKRALAVSHLEPILASGRYPNLARFARQGKDAATDFEFGLGCVLDGIEAALGRRPARRRRRAAR
jgi:AcrR family transcriptional regulator